MAELTVENTYGKALFEAARDTNKVNLILEEITAISGIFHEEPDFHEFFNTPALSGPEKKKVIEQIFANRVSTEVLNFLYVLIDKRRTGNFERIVKEYRKLVNEEQRISLGTILSAEPLTEAQLGSFEEKTGKLLKRNVKLVNEMEPSILGGVKIFVDGKMIDASIRKRLQDMVSSVKQA